MSVFLFLPWAVFAEDEKEETAFLHRVSPGESLAAIARHYLSLCEPHTIGALVGEIQRRNGLADTLIRPDQELRIPLVRSTPAVARTIPKASDFEARGIYVNRFSMACSKMTRLVERLTAHRGNTLILDGKDMSGRLSFPSRVGLATEIGANARPSIRDPGKLFHFLHEKKLHICIRLVLFYDPLLANKRPDLAIRSVTTGGPWKENGKITWVDPSHPVVQTYNLDIAKELATMGIDEIQFDYIRFPTGGNVQDAAYVFDEGQTPKHQIITDFLAEAHRALSPHKVLVSIDVFGIMAWERPEDVQMTGQRIENLANHCEVISPMIYPSHFYGPFEGMANPGDHPFHCVSEACQRFSTPLKGKDVTLRPWIQAFPYGTKRFGEEYVIEELQALDQSRTCGWLLWSAENAYDVSWRALNRWNNTASKEQSMDCHSTELLE
jgi:hypothetical protein